jgi:hypothetical protein
MRNERRLATRHCTPPKQSHSAPAPAPSPHAAGDSCPSPDPFPDRRGPGPATARHASPRPQTTPRQRHQDSPDPPRNWSGSRAITCTPTGAPPTGGCSAVPVAAHSAKADTAGSGTKPAPPPSQTRPAPSRHAVSTACATPHCRRGWPPAPRPQRSLPAPGTACASCSPSTSTADPAAIRPPASRSTKPATQPVAPGWPTKIRADSGDPVRHASVPQLD